MDPEQNLKQFHILINKKYKKQYHILYSRRRRALIKNKLLFTNVLNQLMTIIQIV